MKSLEEKRDNLIDKLCEHHDFSMIKGFNLGWNACAKEYEKELQFWKSFDMKSISDENAELKRKLGIK